MNNSTVKPVRVSTVRETIVLESKPRAVVVPIRSNLEWLMRDASSTAYATIRDGDQA